METTDQSDSLSGTLRELRELTSSSGSPERFGELVRLFLDALETDLESMRAALTECNTRELLEIAHALKGTSSNMGASCLAISCSKLEKACGNGELTYLEGLVHEVEGHASLVRTIMRRELQS